MSYVPGLKINIHGIRRALEAHKHHECAGARCPLFSKKFSCNCQDVMAGLILDYLDDLEIHKNESISDDDFNPDAHSCLAEASEYGICTVCGAIVSGTSADYELHGYDPFDSY